MAEKEEEWRPVPNMRLTEASSWGRIRRDGKLKKLHPGTRGYLQVSLYKITYRVNRLVCMAFHGLPEGQKMEAMHLDNDRLNNRPENLKWGTHAENMAMDRGNNHSHKGEENPNSKLTEEAVREIRAAYQGSKGLQWGRRALARKHGISEEHCLRVATRKIGGWEHLD